MDNVEADRLLRKLFGRDALARPKFLVLNNIYPNKKLLCINTNFVDISIPLTQREWDNLVNLIQLIKNREGLPKDVPGYTGISISRNRIVPYTLERRIEKHSKDMKLKKSASGIEKEIAYVRRYGFRRKVVLWFKAGVELEMRRVEFLKFCDFILEYQSGKHRCD